MLRFVFVVVALVGAASAGVHAETSPIGTLPLPDGRIVGGSNADIRQFPHQISMRYNGRHRCGGSIYSSNIVISASHCVIDVDVGRMTIAAGSTLLSEKNAELPVSRIIMHSSYKEYNNDFDVAILVLKGNFQFSEYIQPIRLATERAAKGTEVTITGWGTLVEDGSIPDHLQKVTVNIVDNADCRKSYSPFLLTARMMCAGVPAGGKDACQGDSGGPLILNDELLGIVSWGIGCARKNFPGVYAAVPVLHEWIVKTAKAHTIEFAFL